jgi:ubiquinone/menaquinone biosynthesis C-methylase UbiE
MNAHLLSVAEWAVIFDRPGPRYVLDVGCGTGYIKQAQERRNPSSRSKGAGKKQKRSPSYNSVTSGEDNDLDSVQAVKVIGVDFSSEMVKLARGNYPDSTFVHTDFLKSPAQPSSSQASSGEDLLAAEIDSVVFNEVLRNFLDIKEALSYAKSLLLLSGVHTHRTSTPAPKEKRIVISNPKGYASISKQHAMNRWLSRSSSPSQMSSSCKCCCARTSRHRTISPF